RAVEQAHVVRLERPGLEPELRPPGLRVLAQSGRAALGRRAELAGALLQRPDGTDAGVFGVEALEPVRERPHGECPGELRRELLLCVLELPLDEIGSAEHFARSGEEWRLQGGEGDGATVGRRVDAVAGEAAG